jgi:outer membrane protein assembly factor BamB/HEAT repeat protein
MLSLSRFIVATSFLVLLAPAAQADEASAADEQLLRSLNLPLDGAGLVDFFTKRTLRDGDRPRIQAMIKRLGDDDFDVREKAMADLVALGALAKPMLRDALKEKDVEVLRRVETCLALADKTSTSEALAAAVRQLGRKPVGGATEALLDFLPFAEDEFVVDEFGPALARVGVKDGKPETALTAALGDRNATRRAVAAEAVGRAAGTNEELRRQARALLKDADVQVRRRAAFGLLAAKDREAIPALIDLLADLPTKQTWRIEEVLFDVAGDTAPSFSGQHNDDNRKRYRDTWAAWWKDHGAKIDIARIGAQKPYLGYTLISHADLTKGARVGKVYELDAAGKERWVLENINFPMDAQVLPNGNVLITEQSGQLITERTLKDQIVWQRRVPTIAVCVRRLPSGNTFIASRSQITEIDRDEKEVWTINRPNSDIVSAARVPSGGAVILTNNGNVVTLDATGKELRSVSIGAIYYGTQIDVLPGGRVLVPIYSQNKVVEFDAEGRQVWSANATRPTSAQRLPNGHTLISSRINPTVTEVNRAGEVVWTHQVQNARQVKASRR